MAADDMCDVIHYVMEDDLLRFVGSAEHPADVVSAIRASIYSSFYDRKYRGDTRTETFGIASDNQFDAPAPVDAPVQDPARRKVKAYVPPTHGDAGQAMPFGSLVGEPLG